MKKTLLALALTFLFLSPFPALADDDTDTLTRTVWACKGGTDVFMEFRTAKLEGRQELVSAFLKKGLCFQLKAGTEIHVLGSDGNFERELITFRRRGHFEGLTTEGWYALSPPDTFSSVTKMDLSHSRSYH